MSDSVMRAILCTLVFQQVTSVGGLKNFRGNIGNYPLGVVRPTFPTRGKATRGRRTQVRIVLVKAAIRCDNR